MPATYDAILMNSGGKDSLAVAIALKNIGYTVLSIYVDAGQHPPTHAASAARIAADWCDSHDVITLSMASGFDLSIGQSGFSAQRTMLILLGLLKFTPGVSIIATGHSWSVRSIDLELVCNNFIRGTWRANFYEEARPPKVYLPLMGLTNMQVHDLLRQDPLWKQTPTCGCEPMCGACVKCTLREQFIAEVEG